MGNHTPIVACTGSWKALEHTPPPRVGFQARQWATKINADRRRIGEIWFTVYCGLTKVAVWNSDFSFVYCGVWEGEGQVAAAPCKLVCQSREGCAPGKLASARRGERRARGPSALALIIVLSGCFSRRKKNSQKLQLRRFHPCVSLELPVSPHRQETQKCVF